MFSKKFRSLTVTASVALSLAIPGTTLARSDVKRYVVPTGGDYSIKGLLSAGDKLPLKGGEGRYQMTGNPDGLGLRPRQNGASLYMNHELSFDTLSEPVVGRPLYRGAYVDKLRLRDNGTVRSGQVAFDQVYLGDELVVLAAWQSCPFPVPQ